MSHPRNTYFLYENWYGMSTFQCIHCHWTGNLTAEYTKETFEMNIKGQAHSKSGVYEPSSHFTYKSHDYVCFVHNRFWVIYLNA